MSIRDAVAKSLDYRRARWQGWLARVMRLSGNADIQSYLQMKADNAGTPEYYQSGKFWGAINDEFADLLRAGRLQHLRTEYFNRRFAGPEPASRQVWRALLWLYYQRLLELDTDDFLKHAAEPPEGGTGDQEIIDGRAMSLDFLQSVEEVYRICEARTLAGLAEVPRVIVELGAGYGRLAYVCRKMLPDCTYVILDLPEALTCASSWLQRVLPGEVVPYAASRQMPEFTRDTLASRKVWLLGAHQIEALAAGSADVFVNIYSLAEMPPVSIDNYFVHINRVTDGIFFSKQRKLERNRSDQVEISRQTYPVRDHWRSLFYRTTLLYEAFFEEAFAISDSESQ